MLVEKEHRYFLQHVNAITGEFQHRLAKADTDNENKRRVVRKMYIERRNLGLVITKGFEEKVLKLVETEI